MLTSCLGGKDPSPAPVALFEAQQGDLYPEMVDFANKSENATEYHWDFGDGETSTEEFPTHTYTANGVFKVTLTAKGNGQESRSTVDVSIYAYKYFLKSTSWKFVSGKGTSMVYSINRGGLINMNYDQTNFFQNVKTIDFISSSEANVGYWGKYKYTVWVFPDVKPYIEFYLESKPQSAVYMLFELQNDAITLSWDTDMLGKTLHVPNCPSCDVAVESNIQYVFKRQ